MRGGLERWKRGLASQGVRQALAYAFQGSCDAHVCGTGGAEAVAAYSDPGHAGAARFTVEAGAISTDTLDPDQLRRWVNGCDPETGERRGRDLTAPDADLVLDGTINAPKSYSIAALINPDLAREFEGLQDRLRDQIIVMWQRELNARRGAGGRIREPLHRIEVVELQHRRSRALDPHIHRHLWLNVKVLGEDGKWSNIDSRVAMRLHTVINAEGELAARTDPGWVRALARNGYTIGADGEISELAHVVRPLSRRSNQIEANRALLLAEWRNDHPGQEPNTDHLRQIDRQAWAKARPNKPGEVDEGAWESLLRDELAAIDPGVLTDPASVSPSITVLDKLDLQLLAARAVVEADARSATYGGRFSEYDVRAGAIRALAASGVVHPRHQLSTTINRIVSLALADTVDLLADEPNRPGHVKAFMAASTAALKVELADRFDALTRAGEPINRYEVTALANDVLPSGATLEDRQLTAASMIAGTDRLVSVTGPAGAGKTTMLRVVAHAISRQGHKMFVVAPTKKAASVAGREIGASASSLHALLADHGWRWARDDTGAEVWSRLRIGEVDPVSGAVFEGPTKFMLRDGDRVVVDEAGMVDLHTANALAVVAAETGAGIAMVGDHLQARPVGHSGAMACMTRRATAVVELTAVHRFRSPEYAQLTLRMREPASKDAALAVAAELDAGGLIRRVNDHAQATEAMIDAFFQASSVRRRIALVTSTNEEADMINEAIQQRRIDLGQLSLGRLAVGQGDQRLLEGDIVQTRRNDVRADVENRALWTVRSIHSAGVTLASIGDSADIRAVSHDYAASHLHLAYASTVHGIQGETTDSSIVGPGVDAAGFYVGMTRGRARNEAIAIARSDEGARRSIADSMLRGIPEVSIDDSVLAAGRELGRAAVAPTIGRDPVQAAWNDRRRRPFGGVVNIDAVIERNRATASSIRERIEKLNDSLHASKRELLEIDARIGAAVAGQHAGPSMGSEDQWDQALRDRLIARHEAILAEYASRSHEHRRLVRSGDEAVAEGRLRAALDPLVRAREDRARLVDASASAAGASVSTAPSIGR